ncbi:MAG: GmrSD restriction endonuclease domain-containing protein [Anaerolineae bacterium]
MDLPKIDVQDTKLATLLNWMQTGALQVPRFQRDFVWSVSRTRALLDSMYKEYPIGTFFLWTAPQDAPSLIRPLEAIGIPGPRPGSQISYILDGQQRLTSLYCVINGIRLDGTDYSRVCLDLESATAFLANQEEGFEEAIFVHRIPDNERHIAVMDIVNLSTALPLFAKLAPRLQPAFMRAQQVFASYPFSVVQIAAQPLGDAIEIFQRINQAGKRLSRYDLVCANVWREDFDFRANVTKINKEFESLGFGALDETVYTQAFALALKDNCRTAAELSLTTDEIKDSWTRVIACLRLAVEFARTTLGVWRSEYLPYRGILVVLTDFFFHSSSSAIDAATRRLLWQWYWRVTLSERYSSTSPSRMAEDAIELRKLHAGQDASFSYVPTVTAESVRRARMTSTSSTVRNAFICLLALRSPRNFMDGSPVHLADPYFSNLKQAERHHVFPVAWLKRSGRSSNDVHALPNFCFVPADLNRVISDRAPSDYMDQMSSGNPGFQSDTSTHLLNVAADAPIWRDDFEGFLSDRAAAIAGALRGMVDTGPGQHAGVAVLDEVDVTLDVIEVGLRDMVDTRLTAVVGSDYWRRTVPKDVQDYAERNIAQERATQPWKTDAEYAAGRARLNYVNIPDYAKIILVSWDQFSATFGNKDVFQKNVKDLSDYRNALKHSRDVSAIVRLHGQAAALWFENVIERYQSDRMAEEVDEQLESDDTA